MPDINISISPPLFAHAESQISEGESASISEYVERLIEEDRERQQRRAELEQSLIDAMDAGSTPMTDEDFDDIRAAVRQRAAARRNS